jgi:two-component system alkaline phosphatase synthesis response regulator PhoP
MTRVLVVEDERDFARLMEDVLRKEQFLVTVARDGIQGLRLARESPPDIVLLDWNLPGRDGLDVCKTLKADPATRHVPIVMLTVREEEMDAVLGLEMGADDYISKRALRPRELVARVRAALRKQSSAAPSPEFFAAGDLSLDAGTRRVTVGGQETYLRPKEFELLRVFLKNPGRVLTRSFLQENVWGEEYLGSSRTIDSTVAHLRRKIGAEGRRIEGLKGVGYRFEAG